MGRRATTETLEDLKGLTNHQLGERWNAKSQYEKDSIIDNETALLNIYKKAMAKTTRDWEIELSHEAFEVTKTGAVRKRHGSKAMLWRKGRVYYWAPPWTLLMKIKHGRPALADQEAERDPEKLKGLISEIFGDGK